jgi:nitric oxide reductase subunit B
VLSWIGTRIYQEMPPRPQRVVSTDGGVIVGDGEIQAGQNVWQSLGGMEVGSIWGHGSYVAPDWTADWLHREAMFILNRWADTEFGSEYEKLSAEQQAQLSGRLAALLRENKYDAATETLTSTIPTSSRRVTRTMQFRRERSLTGTGCVSCRRSSSGRPGPP